MKVVTWIAMVLVIVGALNWGLVGFFEYNLVEALLGSWPMVMRVVYGLVGVGGLWMVFFGCRGCCCESCKK
ncbi:DUF378 domain-containing protein [Candidatus Peregrinibacteria bacterium]|nr:DUF378 domain-containing protein [Candidatus Peregrinibacteria bacterium]